LFRVELVHADPTGVLSERGLRVTAQRVAVQRPVSGDAAATKEP
jgi:Fe2+ or Zn2+ uptake regulation protein